MKLDRLRLGKAHVEYPDRWQAGNPLENFYAETPDGKTIVRHEASDQGHVVTLSLMVDSEPYGDCTCKGFKHHPGPCKHLCAVYRAWTDGLVSLPDFRPEAIIAESIDPKQERVGGSI